MEIGARFGAYEVIAKLGEGGMGEVYRARDTRLNRDVAIKILPAGLAADADRVLRFAREAQTLAAINHPHIAQIYGFEEAGAIRALVMELVDGETLAECLARGAMPAEDVVNVARQIAEALEAAHEAGIVHRDLKPANVKVRPDGTVKVLDFGLAKTGATGVAGADPLNSPTLSLHATEAGMILGTAAYMAPEQARGQSVDKRADIWAFGVVLFEMLAGRRLFVGHTASDVVAEVLKGVIDWTALPPDTPPALTRLLARCLQRDPRQRLRDIGDARLELDAAIAESPAVHAPAPRRLWPLALGLALAGLVVGLALDSWWPRPPAATEHWTATRLGGARVSWLPRLSPDGRTLAFAALVDGQTQVGLMNPQTGDWSLLTRDAARGPMVHVAWSRDGTQIYYARHRGSMIGDIYAVPPLGGEPRFVLDNATSPEPLADGSVLVTRLDADGRYQLHRFWPDTGRLAPLNAAVHTLFMHSLRVFDDAREAALFGYVLDAPDSSRLQLLAVDLQTGRARVIPTPRPVEAQDMLPVGVSRDGRSIYIVTRDGHSSSLVALPRHGATPGRVLLTTTALIVSVEEAPDGRLYIDQVDRTLERLRLPASGGVPEVLATGLPASAWGSALELADGRTVHATQAMGRYRLLAARPREEPMPFVHMQEDARGPLARVGARAFAFVAGTLDQSVVVIASSSDGRILRRLEGTRGRVVSRLGASPDGQVLYFVADETVWSIPATDGVPTPICRGTALTVDPGGRFLLVQRTDANAIHVVRREHTGEETRLSLPQGFSFVRESLWPEALRSDGRLAVTVETQRSWFWQPAVLNIRTGLVERIPLDYSGDVEVDLAWSGDRILALARRMESGIWAFDRRTAQ